SAEKAVQRCCLEAIEAGIIKSAHDCSEGGLAVALAEAAIMSITASVMASERTSEKASGQSLGATVVLPNLPIRRDAHLFGESQSRIVLTVAENNLLKLEHHCEGQGVPMAVIGRVEGQRLTIRVERDERPLIDLPVEAMRKAWEGAIGSYFQEGETQH
ncbi:MAG: hypothetical protein HY203_05325, partial [Nitrospirae bacterium]|nr:hypothetical protein [Nitrospirota bacterium]